MDDEEEDMLQPIPRHFWRSPLVDLDVDVHFQDPSTQISHPGTAPAPAHVGMLPCQLAQEPRPFFRGNAEIRWHFPARIERHLRSQQVEEHIPEQQVEEEVEARGHGELELRLAPPQPPAEDEERERRAGQAEAQLSVEAQIGRKLRQIGDSFNQEHLAMFERHQRDHLPLWWRVGAAVFGYLFQRVDMALPQAGDPR